MDRILLTEHFANALSQVDDGVQQIKRQREHIFKLHQAGRSTKAADLVLRMLVESQTKRIADRNQLKAALEIYDNESVTMLIFSTPSVLVLRWEPNPATRRYSAYALTHAHRPSGARTGSQGPERKYLAVG